MTRFAVIEGGLRQKREASYLSGAEFIEMLKELSTADRRAVLADARAAWPMHTGGPETHAFLLSFAKWIEAHAET